MPKTLTFVACAALALLAGCQPPSPPAAERPGPYDAPPESRKERRAPDTPAAPAGGQAEVSYDTPRDEEFAHFVASTAGGMVRKVAVGIERKGTMRVEVGEAVAPEDVLPLTKSLLAGARKDFPGKRFTLTVYDPHGEPILKAHYRPDHGVHYEVARSDGGGPTAGPKDGAAPGPAASASALPPGGTTEKDRRFAAWAVKTAPRFLRYVQADLERRGRLWFGVTREVQPADVPPLTKSLLEGARHEFPRRELTATVFDPEGERIGRATLTADGKVHWVRE